MVEYVFSYKSSSVYTDGKQNGNTMNMFQFKQD